MPTNRSNRRLDRTRSQTAARQKSAPGRGIPWNLVFPVIGVVAITLLVAYLVVQARGTDVEEVSAAERAEQDQSADIPGTFAASQGRGHYTSAYSPTTPPMPFCEGVVWSGMEAVATGTAEPTAAATATATVPSTAAATGTATEGTCRNSNPPSSGRHLGVERNVEVDGFIMNIPPDPNVYPPDLDIPRDAIPHILEHSGVFVGYNCADGDDACLAVVQELEDVVNDRIDNNDDRVIMARYTDLPVGEIGLSGWTRWMRMPYTDFDEDVVSDFIGTNSCRFDPEGFC